LVKISQHNAAVSKQSGLLADGETCELMVTASLSMSMSSKLEDPKLWLSLFSAKTGLLAKTDFFLKTISVHADGQTNLSGEKKKVSLHGLFSSGLVLDIGTITLRPRHGMF
jgi:hypothetical protein